MAPTTVQAHVTAVVFGYETTGGLVDTVRSVLSQRRRPHRLVLVTDESSVSERELERITDLCTDVEMDWHHLVHPTNSAISLAEALDDVLHDQFPSFGTYKAAASWLWFLTSNTVAHERSLGELVNETEVSPTVRIAGSKQVEHANSRNLINVGLTVSRQGEIFALIDEGELDQGQYDNRDDVFAVSLPGMLIRYDIWRDLDGIDDLTPEAGQAVDLCWRARLTGARVVVVPTSLIQNFSSAEIRDKVAALNESLPEDHAPFPIPEHGSTRPSLAAVQETATWLNLKHRNAWSVIPAWIWSLIAAIGIFLGSLILKAPGYGAARAGGSLRTLTRPFALGRSRSRASSTRVASYGVVDQLRASSETVRDFRRGLVEVNEPNQVIGDGTGSNVSEHEPTGGHDDFTDLATPERNWVGIGLVTSMLLLGALSIVGMFSLLGSEALAGGALAATASNLSELFRSAVSGWSQAGVGAPGHAGPGNWLLVLMGLTGSANIAILVLYLLAMPLAAAGAWTMVGAVTRSRGARFALAMAWGLAPTLLISLGEGRLGGLLVHLLLPWLVLSIIRATGSAAESRLDPEGQPTQVLSRPGHRGVPSWTASGWVAILFAMVTAASPSLLVPGTLLLLVMAAGMRRRGRPLWWTPLLSWTLFLPTLISNWNNPRALLADPFAVPYGYTPADPLQQLLGWPTAVDWNAGIASLPWTEQLVAGAPWAAVTMIIIAAPVILLALIGVFATRRPTGNIARLALVGTALGLATGILASEILITVDGSGLVVPIYIGPAVSVTCIGLLIAAAAGVDTLRSAHKAWSPVAITVMVLVSIVSGAIWLTPRLINHEVMGSARDDALMERQLATADADPRLEPLTGTSRVGSSPAETLPASAADRGTSPLATKTMVIERNTAGLSAHVVSGSGATLEQYTGAWTSRALTGSLLSPDVASHDAADEAIRSLAAGLTTGAGVDPRAELDRLGVAFIVLRDNPNAPGETSTAAQIDSVTGLTPVGLTQNGGGWLWRVAPTDDADGVALLTRDGGIDESISAGMSTASVRITDTDGAPEWFVAADLNSAATALPGSSEVHVDLPPAGIDTANDPDAEPLILHLAERADPGFEATVDGEPLDPIVPGEDTDGVASDWNQRFEIPVETVATGGTLEVEYTSAMRGGWLWLIPLIVFILAALLAIPAPAYRRTRDTEAKTRNPYPEHPLDADAAIVKTTDSSAEDEVEAFFGVPAGTGSSRTGSSAARPRRKRKERDDS